MSRAQNGNAAVLQLKARAGPGAVDLSFECTLADEDAALLTTLFGYPSVRATVELSMHSRLPRPVPPDFAWPDLELNGRYGLSGSELAGASSNASGFEGLTITNFTGAFTLTAATLSATADTGAFAFAQTGSTSIGRCRIADPVRLTASATELVLSNGLGCVLTDDRGTVEFKLHSPGDRCTGSGPTNPAATVLQLTRNLQPRGRPGHRRTDARASRGSAGQHDFNAASAKGSSAL